MRDENKQNLRRGWTTGACATAALKVALMRLWAGAFPAEVEIVLPKGTRTVFSVAHTAAGADWAEAGITKDAGDDPDVTHGALIIVRVQARAGQGDVQFHAGEGVGTVTKKGLPLEVGQAAINPVPRQMMQQVVQECAHKYGKSMDVDITISVPGGAVLAEKTWNPRLGIIGGISILGTTGVVRPFSCAAWIASIHRGVDVARAAHLDHVAGCTGATSEKAVQEVLGLPDHAMLDMGDFAGGMLKYIARHPVKQVTIGGGIGKMTKLAQGARDLHSARSQVDFEALAQEMSQPALCKVNTALEAFELLGPPLAQHIALRARERAQKMVDPAHTHISCMIVDRSGQIIASI